MPPKTCAFLTMEDTAGWSIDADLAFAPLAELGWRCEWLPWRTPAVDWERWDAVYIAATWDYPRDPQAFLAVMQEIDRSSAILVNDLELVRWNIPKTYLKDLASGGADIVPSRWYERFADCALDDEFEALASDALIVKPVISTSAEDTFLLARPVDAGTADTLAVTFADRPFIVQPFISGIRTDGECSLFYIGGEFSHAIRKLPKPADFRVQEEHGADIRALRPDPVLVETADRVIALVAPTPLYARCDLIRDADGIYRVMELELVEPSLYLRMDDRAPARFAAAFDRHVSARRGDRR